MSYLIKLNLKNTKITKWRLSNPVFPTCWHPPCSLHVVDSSVKLIGTHPIVGDGKLRKLKMLPGWVRVGKRSSGTARVNELGEFRGEKKELVSSVTYRKLWARKRRWSVNKVPRCSTKVCARTDGQLTYGCVVRVRTICRRMQGKSYLNLHILKFLRTRCANFFYFFLTQLSFFKI